MTSQALSDFHQQLIQSWTVAQPIPKQWRFAGQRSRKPVAVARVVPVAIAWSLTKNNRKEAA